MDKKNYPQAYLKECKYEIKIKKMTRFIDFELDYSGDSNDSNSE